MGQTGRFGTRLLARTWLSEDVFECELERPRGFAFRAGQSLRLEFAGVERDYSVASGPEDESLLLCIKRIEGGKLSPALAAVEIGEAMSIAGPRGFFFHRGSPRPSVLVATGTGVAPFRSMARSGLAGFLLLHGVRDPEELHYRPCLEAAAGRYVACVSGPRAGPADFRGRVSAWMETRLEPGKYDFYLCGHRDMIRDLSLAVDALFPGSMVFSEIFN